LIARQRAAETLTHFVAIFIAFQLGQRDLSPILWVLLAGALVYLTTKPRSSYLPASVKRSARAEHKLKTGKKFNPRKHEYDHKVPFSKGGPMHSSTPPLIAWGATQLRPAAGCSGRSKSSSAFRPHGRHARPLPPQRLRGSSARGEMSPGTVRERRSRIRPLRAGSGRKKVNLQNEPTEFVRVSKVTKSISADKLFPVWFQEAS
jgi:hypothetical protein